MQSDTACVHARMRHSHESLCEVSHALAALAQPASFGNRYFRKAVGLLHAVTM